MKNWYTLVKESTAFNTPTAPSVPDVPKSNQNQAVYEVTDLGIEGHPIVSEVTFFMGADQAKGDSGYFFQEWFKDENGNPKKVMRHGDYEAKLA